MSVLFSYHVTNYTFALLLLTQFPDSFVKLKALNVAASMFLRDSLSVFIVVSENSSAAFSPQE